MAQQRSKTAEKPAGTKNTKKKKAGRCPVSAKCGGCTLIDVPYEEQLAQKQRRVEELIGQYGRVNPILKMKNPDHYRNKVTSVFARDRSGKPVCGIYKAGTHEVVGVKACLLEDLKADRIIQTIFSLIGSFRIRVYDEDAGTGLLRYVQVRTARATRQVMVTLVTASPVIPSCGKFVNAILHRHPEITTIVQNINGKKTTMVLGDREKTLFGPGYIEDVLCGKRFRLSSRSFYQVNALQTEKLYNVALDYAGFSGKEKILDTYCGIGTIGIIASDRCKEVMGVELNPDAVKDAKHNITLNGAGNVQIYCNDAGRFMMDLASRGESPDVLFMDPPRSGASEGFLNAVLTLRPRRVVYISCEPTTLARDLDILCGGGAIPAEGDADGTAAGAYRMKKAVPVDMFPYTEGVETVCLMERNT